MNKKVNDQTQNRSYVSIACETLSKDAGEGALEGIRLVQMSKARWSSGDGIKSGFIFFIELICVFSSSTVSRLYFCSESKLLEEEINSRGWKSASSWRKDGRLMEIKGPRKQKVLNTCLSSSSVTY